MKLFHGWMTISSVHRERAQAATELAVFGAVLIFLIGIIIRTGLSSSHRMNSQLKAFRWALLESYKTAESTYSSRPSKARNVASVLVMEDRLSSDAGKKFGERDRIPIMASGSGTYSKNLFLDTDLKDQQLSVPMFDMIVNGQRFPFATGDYLSAHFSRDNLVNCADDTKTLEERRVCWADDCFKRLVKNSACLVTGIHVIRGRLFQRILWVPEECLDHVDGDGNPDPLPLYFAYSFGCPVVYKQLENGRREYCTGEDIAATPDCPANMPSDQRFDLNFDGTPDIPKNSPPLINIGPPTTYRKVFQWQWVKVPLVPPAATTQYGRLPVFLGERNRLSRFKTESKGVLHVLQYSSTGEQVWWTRENVLVLDAIKNDCIEYDTDGTTILVDHCPNWSGPPAPMTEDALLFLENPRGYTPVSGEKKLNMELDADGDGYNERIFIDIDTDWETTTSNGKKERYVDFQYYDDREGDMNFQDEDTISLQGLQDDMQMYSFTEDGTAYIMEEGKLYGIANGQFIRSVTRQNQVDIISRKIRLKRNTTRLCVESPADSGQYIPRQWGDSSFANDYGYAGMHNPVEVCVSPTESLDETKNCFATVPNPNNANNPNITQTCMDVGGEVVPGSPDPLPVIFVRSRIRDVREKKWITNVKDPFH